MGIQHDRDLTEEQRKMRRKGNLHTFAGFIVMGASYVLMDRIDTIYILPLQIIGMTLMIISIRCHAKYFKMINRDWKKFFRNWRMR